MEETQKNGSIDTSSLSDSQWEKIGFSLHHGINIPLFALHSKASCGIGEYEDLIPLIDFCHEIGFDIIQLLPLNDTGKETSPYSALSAFALNPIHLRLTTLNFPLENEDLKRAVVELQDLTKNTQRIDYKSVRDRKNYFFREYYRLYDTSLISDEEFQKFKKESAYWLNDYALFKTLKEKFEGVSWEEWPEEFKNFSFNNLLNLSKDILDEMGYHILLQFLCFKQLGKVKAHADKNKVFIKGDIPILINRESADVWRHRNLFLMDLAAGAPPDMYAKMGQKWGFPLYNWESMALNDYDWWIERLKVVNPLYHLYRIDHIVGFFRIWGIPLNLLATEGRFIPENSQLWIPQGERIMKVMLNNSEMLPIGEDLGNVPKEVRECLKHLKICGTKVMRWERYWEGSQDYISLKEYPKESMTTVSTHDSETLAMWWKDQESEAKLFAHFLNLNYEPQLSKEQRFTILYESHHTNSLFHINLLGEYLALFPDLVWDNLEDERINIPGFVLDTNWSYRFRPSLEEIVNKRALKEKMVEMIKV